MQIHKLFSSAKSAIDRMTFFLMEIVGTLAAVILNFMPIV